MRWSNPEKQIVKRHYPSEGEHGVQQRLEERGYTRTLKAIGRKASELGVHKGIPIGYMALTEFAIVYSGGFNTRMFNRFKVWAERDNVLFRGPGKVKYAIPEEWAYRKLDELAERRAHEAKGWFPTSRVASVLGVTERRLRENPLPVERVRGLRGRWLYNPSQVLGLVRRAA